MIRLDKLYRIPRWPFAVLVLTGRIVTAVELVAHAEQVRQQFNGQVVAIPTPAALDADTAPRSRAFGRRAAGRVRPSSGRRRSDSVEQLRLLPGE